jgi:S-DNA-T family DNA segregation ATPase FtsK/SpoIIIE
MFSEIGSLVLTGTLLLVGATLVARSSLADSSAALANALGQRVPSLKPGLQVLTRALAGAGRALDPLPLFRALWRKVRRPRRKPLAEPLSSVVEAAEPPALSEGTPEGTAQEPVQAAKPARRRASRTNKVKARQVALPVDMPEGPGVKLPPAELLETAPTQAPISRRELLAVAELIRRRCAEFQVEGQVTEFHPGPVVTTYEFRPNAGIKLSRITALADDLALALEAENVRIDRIPGRPTVGIEVPNRRRETITLRQVVESPEFRGSSDLLTMGLGKSQSGDIFCAGLSKMPHLLVAGSTGSGKSVGLNAMIASVLYRAKPDQVKFILVDPKMLELGVYAGLPHLLVPVVTDMKLAGNALKWAVREMERRYRLLAACNVRHLDSFNRLLERDKPKVESAIESMPARSSEKYEAKHLPYIVIVVDELADMLMTTGPDVVEAIARLAQKARAVGIHLILAT